MSQFSRGRIGQPPQRTGSGVICRRSGSLSPTFDGQGWRSHVECPRCRWTMMPVSLLIAIVATSEFASSQDLVTDVEAQPLKAQVRRVVQALDYLGVPLTQSQSESLQSALDDPDDHRAVEAIQRVFDEKVLAQVNINPESRVKVAAGEAPKHLIQHGWSVFLIKVHNEGGVTAKLSTSSPNARPVYKPSTGAPNPNAEISSSDVEDRWLDVQMFDSQPLTPNLTGLPLEYRIVQIYSRDAGKREATLTFDVGQGTQDLGFRNEVAMLFESAPAVEVVLDVLDDDGKPTMGSFVFRDAQGHVYPARSRRLAPDFFFHDQIYRRDGESVLLPPGKYTVTFGADRNISFKAAK